jgi:CRISPR-associated protein Csd1
MLRELYDAAVRFSHEEDWLPPFYKRKSPKWVIEVRDGKAKITGPYEEGEFRLVASPDRQRSGTAVAKKPFLGMDKAIFVLQSPHDWPPFWQNLRNAPKTKTEMSRVLEVYSGFAFRSLVDEQRSMTEENPNRVKDNDEIAVCIPSSGQASDSESIPHSKPKWILFIQEGKAPHLIRRSEKAKQSNGAMDQCVSKGFIVLEIGKAWEILILPSEWPPFWSLMINAAEQTKDSELKSIVEFAAGKGFHLFIEEMENKARDDDLVGFRLEGSDHFPFEKRASQEFWLQCLAHELTLPYEGQCSITGDHQKPVQTIPQEIVVMGQKCQISSFNKSAFTSFGKEQTTNASISLEAIAKAIQSLQYLANHPRHHAVLARGDSKRGTDPLRNYFATFWLQHEETQDIDGEEFNMEDVLALPLKEYLPHEGKEDDGQNIDRFAPPVDLQLLDELLIAPWTGKEITEELPENSFYMAILSANTGRLVMRDWISESISRLCHNLVRFYRAVKIISPWGDCKRVFPIPMLVKALRSEPRSDASDPREGELFRKRRNVDCRHSDLLRSFVRSAYRGQHPDPGILAGAVQRFRNLKTLGSCAEIHVLAGIVKLILTYDRKEAETMQTLDRTRNVRAYLCGQILAILEEAQRRAAGHPLNTTLVDRAYGAASMSPKSMLPALIRTLEMGHLPKIRKKWKAGYDELRELLEGIGKKLDDAGGYPVTLSLQDQAEFALGFYCLRADFRKAKQDPKDS